MTPAIQNSLNALALAARKGMVPVEVEMHLEKVVEGIEELQKRALVKDEIKNMVTLANAAGLRSEIKSEAPGRSYLDGMRSRGDMHKIIRKLADDYASDADRDMALARTIRLDGYTELSNLIGNFAELGRVLATLVAEEADKEKAKVRK